MTTSSTHRETAKIYQFPIGGRAALNIRRETEKAVDALPAQATKVVATSGWYHEAAIQDAEPARKR